MKIERMEVSLQFAKLAVNVPNAISFFISPVVVFAFPTGEVIEDKFFVRPFFDWNVTNTKLLGNFQKDVP